MAADDSPDIDNMVVLVNLRRLGSAGKVEGTDNRSTNKPEQVSPLSTRRTRQRFLSGRQNSVI